MKKLTGMIIIAALLLSNTIPAYAWPEYSEETKRLGRKAGLQMEDLEWEEIDRRQQEYRKRKGLGEARSLVRKGNTEALYLLYDDIPDTLSQLIRTAFVPGNGRHFIVADFIVADFSAIEAGVIALVR